MASLLDIAPKYAEIEGVTVPGISAEGIAHILNQFPEIQRLVQGRDVPAEEIMQRFPLAVSVIIAAGCGHPGDKDHEAAAARLSIETQLDFLQTIMRVTFPNGLMSFVERVTRLASGLDVENPPTKAPGTSSRKRSTN